MRATPLIVTGVLLVSGFATACGSTAPAQQTSSTTGVGGADPATSSVTVTATSSVSTTTSTSTSTSAGAGGAIDIGQPSDVYPAKHPVAPKVISFGGPVLTAPKVYPVFFKGDNTTIVNSTIDFYNKIGPSAYWTATVGEYGVGALTSGAPIQLDEMAAPSISDDDIQAWLAGKLNADDLAFPTPDDNTIIALNYPDGVAVSLAGSNSCDTFLGYHSNVTLNAAHGGRDVAYLVIPRCPKSATGMSEIDAITDTGAHELIEASTDPYPQTNVAYGQVDNNHAYWRFALGGGETGDLCAQSNSASYVDPEVGFMVQRAWSNKAAAASADPCVPADPANVYFNSAPVMNDTITLSGGGQAIKVKGVQIPIGATKTIDLDLFSEAPVGPWTVEAHDLNEVMGGQPQLDFSLDANEGQNGQKLHLSITPLKANQYKSELFYLTSKRNGTTNFWIGIVGN